MFTERAPNEFGPRGAILSQREIDAILSALPVDTVGGTAPEADVAQHIDALFEADVAQHIEWAIDAIEQVHIVGLRNFLKDALLSAKGDIQEGDNDACLQALHKYGVQMMTVGRYLAGQKIKDMAKTSNSPTV